MTLSRHLCCWACLLVSVTLAAAAECGPSSFNFFPPHTTNIPRGWNKGNQTQAGNDCDGHLLPIAVQGIPKPLLHFLPIHSLLSEAAAVPAEYLPAAQPATAAQNVTNATQAVTRKLLAIADNSTSNSTADSTSNSSVTANTTADADNGTVLDSNGTVLNTTAELGNWTVVVPAQYNFSVTVNGKLWFTSKTFKGSGEVPVVNFNANLTEGRRDVFDPEIFREGINTVVINVTLLRGSAAITDGNISAAAPSKDETFSSPPIDFYFFMNGNETHDSRPKAEVKVQSCQPDLSIELRNTTPPPVMLDGYRLTYTPTNTSRAFFLPVYYVYGSFLQGLDGSTDMQSDNTEGNVKNFGVYITRVPGSPSSFNVNTHQLNSLREGWYTTTVEGSIWSPNAQYDNLMSVSGIDRFGQKDGDYVTVLPGGNLTNAISLYGGFKGAGWVLPDYNKTRVGIQRSQTWLNYFQGPETAITLGQKAMFSWEFSGLGNASCEINGVNPNSLTGLCSSPLVYYISTTLNQTLALSFKDVCGLTHKAMMTFGTFGWEVAGGAGSGNELGGSGILSPPSGGELAIKRSNSGSSCRRSWLQLAVTAVTAAWLLGLLLL